jgi:hypothetical protein
VFQMKTLLCILVLHLSVAFGCYSQFDYNPRPLIEQAIVRCELKAAVEWECYWNVKERITCHSCVLENIRVKCQRLPDYIEYVEEADCRRLKECLYTLDFRQCYWLWWFSWTQNIFKSEISLIAPLIFISFIISV